MLLRIIQWEQVKLKCGHGKAFNVETFSWLEIIAWKNCTENDEKINWKGIEKLFTTYLSCFWTQTWEIQLRKWSALSLPCHELQCFNLWRQIASAAAEENWKFSPKKREKKTFPWSILLQKSEKWMKMSGLMNH